MTMFLAAVWCHFLRDRVPVQNSLCPSEFSSEVYFGQLCWVLSLVREVRLLIQFPSKVYFRMWPMTFWSAVILGRLHLFFLR